MKKDIIVRIITIIFQISLLSYIAYGLIVTYYDYKEIYEKNNSSEKKIEEDLENKKNEILYKIYDPKERKEPLFVIYVSSKDFEEAEKELLSQAKSLEKENHEEDKGYKGKLFLEIPALNLRTESLRVEWNTLDLINETLKTGVVRYSSKDILEDGVTTIYGHSSQPLFTTEDYSFFKKLPALTIWNEAILEGEEKENTFKYRVIESKSIKKEELLSEIKKYDKKGVLEKDKYVMLVTCYPINSTEKRWIVLLKREI